MTTIITINQKFLFKHQILDLQFRDECKLHEHDSFIELSVSDQLNNKHNDIISSIEWSENVLSKILTDIINKLNNKHIIAFTDVYDSETQYVLKPYQITTHRNILKHIFNKLKKSINCHFKVSLILDSKIRYTISSK